MVLILGLDGADRESIAKLDMPFLHSLLAQDHCSGYISTHARGWWEIITGQSAKEAGVWYTRQLIPNSATFGQQLGLKARQSQFFWEKLCQKGVRVGIVNVPTTKMPKEIDGFFISGAGGGMRLDQIDLAGISCDDSVTGVLKENKYIVDVRVTASKISSADELFQKLLLMTETQIKSVIKLQKIRKVQMIFYANMALRTLLNLYMRQIYENSAPNSLFSFTRKLDTKFKNLFEALGFNDWILISDHGTEPYFHDLCLTPELNNNIFSYNSKFEKVRRKVFRHMTWGYTTRNDLFSVRYIPGIYINDERFGLRAASQSTIDILLERKTFLLESLHDFGLNAKINVERSNSITPDLYFEKPFGCFFENSYLARKKLKSFVTPCMQWDGNFSGLKSDIVGGVKSSCCLFSSNTKHTAKNKEKHLSDFPGVIKEIML